MHTNINDFLINENIKQMREYLQANGLEKLEHSLSFIKDKFQKKPNYISIFTKIMVDKDGKMHGTEQQFNSVADWIINKNHLVTKLPKKIQDYKSIEEIQDDIRRLDLKELSNKFYHSLYANMRDAIDRLSPTDREKMDNISASFMTLDENIRKTFPPLLHFQANHLTINDLANAMENFIKSGLVNSSKNGVLSVIEKSNNANVVYNANNILIIQSNDKDVITKLGSNRWCIVYNPDSYFDDYVGGENLYAQFLCFNFNLPQSNKYSLFGVSLDMENKAIRGGCQDRENGETSIAKISGLLGIDNGIFKNPYIKVIDDLLNSTDVIEELFNMNDTNTVLSLCNQESIENRIISQLEAKLQVTSNTLFDDAFNIYDYLINLNIYFDDTQMTPIFIHILVLIQTTIKKTGIGASDFSKYVSNHLDSNTKIEILEEYIPEDYYNYNSKFQQYADMISLFQEDDMYDYNAFNYIIYEHTTKDSDINKKYRNKLVKPWKLDDNNISTYTITDFTDLEFLFENDLSIISDSSLYESGGSSDDWEYTIEKLSMHSILSIYEKLLENDVELDSDKTEIYKELKNSEYNSLNYTDTISLFKDDADFLSKNSLLGKYIEKIITDPDEYDAEDSVTEIRDILNDAHRIAYDIAIHDEYFDRFVSELSKIFLYQSNGDDTKETTKSIYSYDEENIVFKLDAFKIIKKEEMELSNLVYEYSEDFDLEDILKYYSEYSNKLSFSEPEYASIDNDTLNEEILNNL